MNIHGVGQLLDRWLQYSLCKQYRGLRRLLLLCTAMFDLFVLFVHLVPYHVDCSNYMVDYLMSKMLRTVHHD